MIKLKFLIFFSLLLVHVLFGQTTVLPGGELSGSNSWQGIIRIQGDIIIPAGSRLTIQPGTQILFDVSSDRTKSGTDKTRCEIIVRGSLLARGQANNKIIFSSSANTPRMSDWYGIQFLHSKAENAVEYCVIEYGYNGITLKNTNLTVANSEIRYNYNAGIRTEVKAKPNLTQNIISENGYAGVICELGAAPILTENLITGNPMGIVIMSLSQPNIGSINRDDKYNPGKNQFLNNEEYDIYNHSNKPILAQNNTWGNVDDTSIPAKIYDSGDNNKYGTIEYQPVFNSNTRQSTLSRFMILAQDTEAPTQDNQLNLTQDQSDSQISPNQQDIKIAEQSDIIQQIDSTMESVFQNQSQTTATPLIASTQIPEPGSADSKNAGAGQVEQLDYGRIFLEPFLDSGRKKLLHKETIQVTASFKNVMSPGTIRVKVIVNQQGLVESASILRGINEYMDEAVLLVVRKNVYEIGTVNGIPVRFSTNEVFRFQ
jgi:hypothetical protein